MPLKRLILLLSLLVVVTFAAGVVVYHATVYFNRLSATKASAKGELELAAQRLTNEMVDWQRFGRTLRLALPGIGDGADAPEIVARMRGVVEETYGLRALSLVAEDGEPLWQVGNPDAVTMTCPAGNGAVSRVTGGADTNPSLIHCLPLAGETGKAASLVLNTQLDTLSYELPSSALLAIILVDTNGRVLAGGQLHAIERYPVTDEAVPLTGSVHISGEDYDAASIPVAGLDGAHLVALTSHRTVWSRALDPLLAPAGIVYAVMAVALILLVRKLYRAAERDVERRELVEQKLRRSEAMYRELSVSDSLTGLYNRRKFHSDLHHEISRNSRYDNALSLAVMDVDHFKQINDQYGHNEGDRVLRLIGRVLRNSRRKTDTAYRVGGEEFVLMLPETRSEDAVTVVQRIQSALAETRLYTEQGEEVAVTISVGIAGFDGQESDRELFNRADAAMYSVKQGGRGGLAVAPPAAEAPQAAGQDA